MPGLEELSRLVSQVCATTNAPYRWQHALDDLARSLDAKACTLTFGAGRNRSIISTSIEPEAIKSYESHYHRMDFLMAACESDPVGLVRGGWDIVAANKRTEFHNDWQRRYGMTDGLHVRLSDSATTSLVLSAPPRSEPFETVERVRFVNALVPHVRRALSTREQLYAGIDTQVDIGSAPDIVRHALFIVGGDGRVERMNAAAHAIAQGADGLGVRADRLWATAPACDSELQAAIRNALPGLGDGPRRGSDVVCARALAPRPFVVRVTPLDTDDDPWHARAAVMVIDPNRQVRPSKALLQKLFHLTASEHEVAVRMLGGDELKVIAADLGVSLATVKTHVLRIFAKTGTHRQAELVRLLFALEA